jgi:hypothetical protein
VGEARNCRCGDIYSRVSLLPPCQSCRNVFLSRRSSRRGGVENGVPVNDSSIIY